MKSIVILIVNPVLIAILLVGVFGNIAFGLINEPNTFHNFTGLLVAFLCVLGCAVLVIEIFKHYRPACEYLDKFLSREVK